MFRFFRSANPIKAIALGGAAAASVMIAAMAIVFAISSQSTPLAPRSTLKTLSETLSRFGASVPEPEKDGTALTLPDFAWTLSGGSVDGTVAIEGLRLSPHRGGVRIEASRVVFSEPDGTSLVADLSGGHLIASKADEPGFGGDFAYVWSGDVSANLESGDAGPANLDLQISELEASLPSGADSGEAAMTASYEAFSLKAPIPVDSSGFGDRATAGILSSILGPTRNPDIPNGRSFSETVMMSLTLGPGEIEFAISDVSSLWSGDPIAGLSRGADFTIRSKQSGGSWRAFPNEEPEREIASSTWNSSTSEIDFGRDGLLYRFAMSEMRRETLVPGLAFDSFETVLPEMTGVATIPLFAGEGLAERITLDIDGMAIRPVGDIIPPEFLQGLEDPFDIDIDAGIVVDLDDDIFPESIAALQDPKPARLRIDSLELREFGVASGDFAVAATGALSMAEQTSGRSLPSPSVGELLATVSGMDGFLDRLAGMDLIGPQEIAMAENALRAMGKPGVDDTLSYDIRLGENGSITLNGIPLDQLSPY